PSAVRASASVRASTLARGTTPVRTSIQVLVPASESLPNSALSSDPPQEPEPELILSPDKDPEPTLRVKHVPSVTSGFGPIQEPFPALTPLATDLLGTPLGSTPRSDLLATKLTDSSSGHILGTPILGAIPSLAVALPISTNAFASTSENIHVDSKIVIRVVYW
ncbi:hypothetical protein E2I00_011244, partial [Balaenoptera physalus]